MFKAILWSQWKQTRTLVLVTTVIAFGLPVAAMRMMAVSGGAMDIVSTMQAFGAMYPLLAALTGLLVAMAAWGADHAGRHTYALSLPVTRARYAAMRYGAGAAFMGVTVVGLLVGTLIVAASNVTPEGLHVYALPLTLRFALAAFVSYSIFFAISSATPQTAGVVLGAVAAVLLAQFLIAVLDVNYDLLGQAVEFLLFQPGILSVFAGRWMLVDA